MTNNGLIYQLLKQGHQMSNLNDINRKVRIFVPFGGKGGEFGGSPLLRCIHPHQLILRQTRTGIHRTSCGEGATNHISNQINAQHRS